MSEQALIRHNAVRGLLKPADDSAWQPRGPGFESPWVHNLHRPSYANTPELDYPCLLSSGGPRADAVEWSNPQDCRDDRRTTLVLLAILSVAVTALLTVPLVHVDQEPRGPVARNDTGTGIVIYTVDPDGTEHLRLYVQVGREPELPGECTSELVARTTEGAFLDRWGPYEMCNTGVWVITA